MERALTDDYDVVRIAALKRPEPITSAQLERALADDNYEVVMIAKSRLKETK
jgi:hypothetical protein